MIRPMTGSQAAILIWVLVLVLGVVVARRHRRPRAIVGALLGGGCVMATIGIEEATWSATSPGYLWGMAVGILGMGLLVSALKAPREPGAR